MVGVVTYSLIEVDEPKPRVRRISLNRPEKRNALNHTLRGDILRVLQDHDRDPDVRVTILRGNGKSFSAGYDLANGNEGLDLPYFTAAGEGAWPRHVTDGWMGIWDLAKPVIAQVHGYCLAGGSELATCCDLVFIAEDAQMGYPAVRFGVPDMHFHSWFLGMRTAMKMMLTGDSISGIEAARLGWANEAFPIETLEENVLAVAERIAQAAVRRAAAQQADRAPRHGDDGHSDRDPSGHRALRPGDPYRDDGSVHRGNSGKGTHGRPDRTRCAVRRLSHGRGATFRTDC